MSAPLTMRELILQTVRDEITNELRPYRAVVTGLSAGKVQFRPTEAATGSTQLYARLRGFALTVGDVIWVIGKKNPMVLEKVQDSAPVSYTLDAPLSLSQLLTITGRMETGGTAPTPTKGSAAGTTSTVALVSGNDLSGVVELATSGTGFAAGQQIVMTFGTPRPDTNYEVQLTPHTSDAASVDEYISGRATSAWAIHTPAALTTGKTLRWGYRLMEH